MPRPHKPAWGLRVPRLTLRIELTLLYAGPFFLSGVALLSIVLLQTKVTVPASPQPHINPGPAPSPGHTTSQAAVSRRT